MSAIDPASAVRREWWSDDTFLHLAQLSDQALPGRGMSDREVQHPTLPILDCLLSAIWRLGKTGGIGEGGPRAEGGFEALQEPR